MSEKLVEEIKRGNETAYRKLIAEYQDMVISTCYGLVQNKEDAEDVAQEVFVKVFQSINQFRQDSKLSSWIYRIAVNQSLNTLRKNRIKKCWIKLEEAFSDHYAGTHRQETGPYYQPHKKMESDEGMRLIRKAIRELPKNQRTALVLHKYEGRPHDEIAEIMKTSHSSVESLIFRAKKNIRKKLVQYYKGSI